VSDLPCRWSVPLPAAEVVPDRFAEFAATRLGEAVLAVGTPDALERLRCALAGEDSRLPMGPIKDLSGRTHPNLSVPATNRALAPQGVIVDEHSNYLARVSPDGPRLSDWP
jgi:hypothetical protein